MEEAKPGLQPSQEDGEKGKADKRLRSAFGCSLIAEGGILLELPQICQANAQTMFHRFYMNQSFEVFPVEDLAPAALFLAAKMEEKPRKARHVLSVMECVEFRRRKEKYVEESVKLPRSMKLRTSVLFRNEMLLLKELGFRLYSSMSRSPHRYLVFFVQTLQTSLEAQKLLAQKAWAYLNDSFRIDLCVRYPSEVIAVACIFLAARDNQMPLPLSPSPWWNLFEVSDTDLETVALEIVAMYKLKIPTWMPQAPMKSTQWVEIVK